jgi:Icc-related predicted phosphoesterase
MRTFFEAGDASSSVIVTHHAPSMLSLPEHRRSEEISSAYASNLEPLILQYQPRLWIHGHIHHSNNYCIGETRVLANPRSYPDKPNPDFVSDLVIDV